jgi:hypothetical protein
MYSGHEQWTLLKGVYILCRYLPILLWPYVLWCLMWDRSNQDECGGNVVALQQAVFMVLVGSLLRLSLENN